MCLVSLWCCRWLLSVAMCSGKSSEGRVEVCDGGREKNLEDQEDEDVEDVVLVTTGCER